MLKFSMGKIGWAIGVAFLLAGQLCAQDKTAEAAAATNWAAFSQSAAARHLVDFHKPDTNLLAMAVFHATNAQRSSNGLPALAYSKEAELAAAIQTRMIREREALGHENPEAPEFKTLKDRVAHTKAKVRLAAENLALSYAHAYESGRKFHAHRRGKEIFYTYAEGGARIPRHTYASFGATVVQQWMDSPGHRKNILNPGLTHIGVSCMPEKVPKGLVTFYSTQVFITPRELDW